MEKKTISQQISNLRNNFSIKKKTKNKKRRGAEDREWGEIIPFFPSFNLGDNESSGSPSCLKEM